MTHNPHDYVKDQWTNQGIPLRNNTNLEKLLEILVYEYWKITDAGDDDSDLDGVYDSSKVETAVGHSLNKLGELVNVSRRTGETNAQYQARIRANFRASTSSATFIDTVEFTASILDVSIEQIELNARTTGDAPDIQIFVPSAALDDIEISVTTFESLLNQVVAASHAISVLERGTFRVRSASDISNSENGLIAEGGSGGGTLAAEP